MGTIGDNTGGRKGFPVVALIYGNASAGCFVGVGTDFKTAVHIAPDFYVNFRNIFAGKVFKAGCCTVCHIAYIAGKLIAIAAVLRYDRAARFILL